tara:strand:+ start:541 stop:786 length:246 start_codon:yes stop_codon:yes gene_type:complete
MAACKFCMEQSVDSWFGNWCEKCHRLQRLIALFGGDKIMDILNNVLIVSDDVQKEKIKDELKAELTTREYSLRKRKTDDNK